MSSDASPLLSIRELSLQFNSMRGVVRVLDSVTFEVSAGEIIGLVGESGCGKTVTGLAAMRLLRPPAAEVTSGEILFRGEDLMEKTEAEMRALRGKELAMVFQDPLASLNPVFTVGTQIEAVINHHQHEGRERTQELMTAALAAVGMPSTKTLPRLYPHQLSGGMRQRVCLAMALSCGAPLLIGDEPTTALDVTIQAQILRLLLELRRERGMGMVLVTHNVGVAAQTCDRVAVMYAGSIVEEGTTVDVLTRPQHPYTAALIRCLPQGNQSASLETIPGSVPDLIDPPSGCRFHPRCKHAMSVCPEVKPAMLGVGKHHQVACHYVESMMKRPAVTR